ncbi:MAG: tetratricopeptide repeat protein [Proteobacteria bacterium]|nr:tetratricopeptide repeat protein [Pseudomonadota bacterium]
MNHLNKRVMVVVMVLGLVFCLGGLAAAEQGGTLNEAYQKAWNSSYQFAAGGKYISAIQALKPVYKDSDYLVVLRIGYLNYLQGDFAESIRQYTKATQIEPRAVEPWLGLILPQLAQKDYKNAVKTGLAALKLDPNNYTALSKLAFACYYDGDFTQAAKYYQKTVELFPSDLLMRNGLAWALLKAGRKDQSKAQFTQVLLVSPYDQSALLGYEQSK